jgi:hypothetical protein
MEKSCAITWAKEEFGHADLGHGSRTKRAVAMAMQAALTPNGKITEVFKDPADRQGAYCFVQNKAVDTDALVRATCDATVKRAWGHSSAFVAVDGSSLTITDRKKAKGLGPIGALNQGARGVKVLDAIAIDSHGVPLGVTALEWWKRSNTKARKHRTRRAVKEKETQRWIDAIQNTCDRFAEQQSSTRLWFLLDREADSWSILHTLNDSGQLFTVRSNHNRRLDGPRKYLHDVLSKQQVMGHMYIQVSGTNHRKARQAKLSVRALTDVTLQLKDSGSKKCRPLSMNAVIVRESGTTPRGEKPLFWVLLTNHPISCMADAQMVVRGYSFRWRIEDFHKTLKSGLCHAEDTQLRFVDHIIRWATILVAVAMRVERLKHLSRNESELPASVELTDVEIKALKYMKRQIKKRTETIPSGIPTIAQATLWIAELGGYTGKSSGGPPGSITIGRGLDSLRYTAQLFIALERDGVCLPEFD